MGNATELFFFLISNNVDLKQVNDGISPLSYAIIYGHGDIFCYLLRARAPVNEEVQEITKEIQIENSDHLTFIGKANQPIHFACIYGNYNMVKLLLNRGANVNAAGYDEWTPLHYACVFEHLKIINLLLEFGANPNIEIDGISPLYLYVEYTPLVIKMLKNGANPNVQLTAHLVGETALHKAFKCAALQSIQILINHGADLSIRNKIGEEPHKQGKFDYNEDTKIRINEIIKDSLTRVKSIDK